LVSIYNIEGREAMETWNGYIKANGKDTLNYHAVIEEVHDHLFEDPTGKYGEDGLDVFDKNNEIYYVSIIVAIHKNLIFFIFLVIFAFFLSKLR